MTAEETEEALKRRNEKETTEEDSLQIVLIRRRRSRSPPDCSQKEEEEEEKHTAELARYFPLANWSPLSCASPLPTGFSPVGSSSSCSSCDTFMQLIKGALTECHLLSSKWLVGALSLPCRIKPKPHTVSPTSAGQLQVCTYPIHKGRAHFKGPRA